MVRKEKALETVRNLINGQLKAKARIWGSVEAIPERHKRLAGGMLSLRENPELGALAPHNGEFTVDGFFIKRTRVDGMDRITVSLAR